MPDPVKKKRYDYTLLAALFALLLAGLVILLSTSAWNGEVKFHDPFYYLKKQLFATSIGLAGMYVTVHADLRVLRRLALPAYLAAVALSTAVLFVGDVYNGSRRWLSLGPFSFQPSEFAKVAVILFLADLVTRYADRVKRMRVLAGIMVPVLPVAGLVGASNLSTAIIILGIAVILVFIASPKYGQFIWMGVTRLRLSGRVPHAGELPAGAAGDLAKPGGV